jgi:small acid-soluble spore protein D (minor alpha/beta-type SASP)
VANKSRNLVPEADQALERMKFEIAKSMDIGLKPDYNGDMTSRQAGSIGGEMVKRMIQQFEKIMSHGTITKL